MSVAEVASKWKSERVRSVFLFPAADRARVQALLADLAGDQTAEDEWQVDGSCWMYLVDPPYWGDWEDDQLDILDSTFGRRPKLMIHVDISGRIPGHQQVKVICRTLLVDGGVASDDYSDDCWSLSDILTSTKDRRRFFDPS